MVTIVSGILSIFTNPEQLAYLAGSVASPVLADQILPNTDGWPWWSSFLLAAGWLALAYLRGYWKHKKDMKKKSD